MVKVAANRSVLRRIEKTRKEVETSTQMLRVKTLKNLKEIFTAASRVAEGQVKKQRIDRRMVPVSLRQRRSWVLVAGHAAKMMKELAENFDEKEVKLQLDKLEKLVEEASNIGATGWSQREIEDQERSSRAPLHDSFVNNLYDTILGYRAGFVLPRTERVSSSMPVGLVNRL